MGTKDQPIQPGVVAQMTFTGDGPIDTAWDPLMISRGLISLGTAEIYGSYVTSHLTLAQAPHGRGHHPAVVRGPGRLAARRHPGPGGHALHRDVPDPGRAAAGRLDPGEHRLPRPPRVRYNHDVPTQQSLAAQFGQAPPGRR